jgi:hypothetical protein
VFACNDLTVAKQIAELAFRTDDIGWEASLGNQLGVLLQKVVPGIVSVHSIHFSVQRATKSTAFT